MTLITVAEAIKEQLRLRGKVCQVDKPGKPEIVAGMDVSVKDGRARGAVVLFSYDSLKLLETSTAEMALSFPNVPGYLSFRELPILAKAFARLKLAPDLLLIDGQGYAHPRRFGLACHVGLSLGLPSIGVGKSKLTGEYEMPALQKGSTSPLVDQDEVIGMVVRSREGVKPLFVSVGHMVMLQTAVRHVLACTTRYRLPEPIRAAHEAAKL
jgi:deoxyribonuclease V